MTYALDVAEHIVRVGHHGGDFGRDVAAEDFAFSIRRQGFVFQHAGEGAQPGAADQTALQGKDAGGAQPFDVFDRHVNHDAHARVFAQAKAAHAANGKAGEGHVHADLHAFCVIRQEDEALRFFKRAAYPLVMLQHEPELLRNSAFRFPAQLFWRDQLAVF